MENGARQERARSGRRIGVKKINVKPMYPSPVQQLAELSATSKYATPAQQLAEMTLKEQQTELSAPLPSPSLHKQMIPSTSYPPLPDSTDDEIPVTRKLEPVHESVCCRPCNRSKPTTPWTLVPYQVTVIA